MIFIGLGIYVLIAAIYAAITYKNSIHNVHCTRNDNIIDCALLFIVMLFWWPADILGGMIEKIFPVLLFIIGYPIYALQSLIKIKFKKGTK